MMGLLLEDEADCLNHQHKRRRHWPPIRRQRRAAAPYRASGLVLSAIADIATVWAVRQQCGGLPTVVPSSNPMAASCNSELTLPSRFRRRAFAAPIRYAIYMRPEDGQPFGMDAKRSHPEELKK
ncbi:hypothetical protein [Paraburkholderia sp. 35.1]|uniref:hypothetical protein n=1 Tax=Paraburkholderia sp. 35.1 TaxID=2991058 RepID=UPI003D2237CA